MVTVYGLFCIHTGEVYIGCTKGKLNKRMREHRSNLKVQKHSAKRLQALWDTHSESGFKLITLETLALDTDVIIKRKKELAWMEYYDDQDLLLNHVKASYAPPKGAQAKAAAARKANGYRPSAESNEKRRQALKGRAKPKGHGAKVSATKKRLGQKPSLEASEKGTKAAMETFRKRREERKTGDELVCSAEK